MHTSWWLEHNLLCTIKSLTSWTKTQFFSLYTITFNFKSSTVSDLISDFQNACINCWYRVTAIFTHNSLYSEAQNWTIDWHLVSLPGEASSLVMTLVVLFMTNEIEMIAVNLNVYLISVILNMWCKEMLVQAS